MIRPVPAILVLSGLMLAVLLWMGRPPICPCGHVEFWHPGAADAGTSQHLLDWYTPSHLLHGLLFFAMLRAVAPHWPLGWRALAAAAIEVAWEIAENTPWVINRYRDATASSDYAGDSVLNSASDLVAMLAGFALAARLPVWAAVTLGVALELAALLAIRDGLALNVLMLFWPSPAVRAWQAGGPLGGG